jgi:hypothetical protein
MRLMGAAFDVHTLLKTHTFTSRYFHEEKKKEKAGSSKTLCISCDVYDPVHPIGGKSRPSRCPLCKFSSGLLTFLYRVLIRLIRLAITPPTSLDLGMNVSMTRIIMDYMDTKIK